MLKYKVFADAAGDISTELKERYGIYTLPIPVAMGKETYQSGVDLENNDFYQMLEEYEGIPVTSQITPYAFEELYEQGFDIESLDTINDDDLVEDALKITDFREFPRESVAKAKQPTVLEDGVMLSKQMVTKTDKKLQSVQVGFFTHKNQRPVCIKLVYERFTIMEIFILV